MVGSQITNLTPGPSFDHNSCISSLNEQCKRTLGIYILKPFQWYHGGPIWCFFFFFNQGFKHSRLLHKCNFQSGSALGSHWVTSFALYPICENAFHTQTHSLGLMGLYTLQLIVNPMLRLQQHDWQSNFQFSYHWTRWLKSFASFRSP